MHTAQSCLYSQLNHPYQKTLIEFATEIENQSQNCTEPQIIWRSKVILRKNRPLGITFLISNQEYTINSKVIKPVLVFLGKFKNIHSMEYIKVLGYIVRPNTILKISFIFQHFICLELWIRDCETYEVSLIVGIKASSIPMESFIPLIPPDCSGDCVDAYLLPGSNNQFCNM